MDNSLNLIKFFQQFPNEQSCRDYLETMRWNGVTVCPHCKSVRIWRFTNGKLWKCSSCKKQFTVRVGTIFSDSKLPLQKWFLAIYLATSLKKGISSMQLAKYLDITQKTAWFVLHRIRYAMGIVGDKSGLEDEVEADENYFGESTRNNSKKFGEASKEKAAVFGMVQRKGSVILKYVETFGKAALLEHINKHIKRGSRIITDENPSFIGLKREEFQHDIINHKRHYGIGDIHTNSIEGMWSQMKRGIYGIYHHVSKKHLQQYCEEFSFRHNTRKNNGMERFEAWFNLLGCRLTYNFLTK